jgi:hypothetical protein
MRKNTNTVPNDSRGGLWNACLMICITWSVSHTSASGQSIDWFTIDGGGAFLTAAGTLTLSGTVGQPEAGVTMTGGAFALTGGFWAMPVATDVPACPGDLDADGDVDQSDLGTLLAAYGTCPGDPNYSAPAGLLAGDPCVTQSDLGVLLANYATECE